ncbi:hypothetical protein [Amycolatopsis sp. H20-H5]|uniref:hypothetical protein n=1 Tax=Amycolatopsis sp. H20-H5 TaxID=3046309 RepID=UPI002DBB7946|nr:hypothetical protein [Amycolatopsis sp. H20-H5]MEC3978857.1 hypothetical protein [Amycolatopsis sp. H20-H5]
MTSTGKGKESGSDETVSLARVLDVITGSPPHKVRLAAIDWDIRLLAVFSEYPTG